jgi:hypothetical protein
MHLCYTDILIYDALYIFGTQNWTQSSTYKILYHDACKIYYTIPVCATIFLKMNPKVRNM